ncbi:MAG: hypothetical protein AB1635_03470 [Acidobacteriota bacterium]
MRGLASLGEWLAAGLLLLSLGWVLSGPAREWIGPRASIATHSIPLVSSTPPGVPAGAMAVPLLVLLDGTEIRVGDTQAALNTVLSERLADGPPHVSRGDFGDRVTRAYVHRGTRFLVTTERTEPGGPARVSGIYLP